MGREYKIEWKMPAEYDASSVLRKLPSPISNEMTEIYNYSIEENGFYLLDNLVDQQIARHAMKLFDRASRSVMTIVEPQPITTPTALHSKAQRRAAHAGS